MADESGSGRAFREIIASHPVFQGLSNDRLNTLADSCEERRLAADEKLIELGEFNYFLYLLVDGEVKVVMEDGYSATLGEGDIVGEISVSGMSSPVADVIATGDVTALAFPIDLITDIVMEDEDFAEKLRSIGRERMQEDEF